MTTAVGARPGAGAPPTRGGARHRRPNRRRRNLEKVLVVIVFFVAFAVTVVLLGLQWLGNASTSSFSSSHPTISEVQAS